MKTNTLTIIAACGTLFMMSCGEAQNNEGTEATAATEEVAPPTPTLSAVSPSPEYDGAGLAIGSVKGEPSGNDSTKLTFNFDVKNYELTAQTADNGGKLCNNSAKGQHIHFILDNQPYQALYEPTNSVLLANGTEHYLMAFLSRSYHESVKSPGAALVYHFRVDENGKVEKMDDPTTPMVFYSRPKGTYLGEDTKNVLFDYYVWNCNLAEDGYKVNATLKPAGAGAPVSFSLSQWESRFLNNLPMGDNSITLTLADKDGNKVDGPCTEVTRTFTLAAQEPLP